MIAEIGRIVSRVKRIVRASKSKADITGA